MYSKVKDFLTDDDFINYALGVVPQSASKWEAYFKEHRMNWQTRKKPRQY